MRLDLDNSRRPQSAGPEWGPAARVVAGAGGVFCLSLAGRRRGWQRISLAALGLGLLARSATALPTARLLDSGGDPFAFEARRSITIRRPVAEVFALLSDYENYPAFLPNVRAMETLPGLRHRWVMVGPLGVGIPVRDAIRQLVPETFVSWESEPGSALPYAGAALFQPAAGGAATEVRARMSYGPPLGGVGHLGACLLRQDPGSQLDSILSHARAFLEAGRFAELG